MHMHMHMHIYIQREQSKVDFLLPGGACRIVLHNHLSSYVKLSRKLQQYYLHLLRHWKPSMSLFPITQCHFMSRPWHAFLCSSSLSPLMPSARNCCIFSSSHWFYCQILMSPKSIPSWRNWNGQKGTGALTEEWLWKAAESIDHGSKQL